MLRMVVALSWVILAALVPVQAGLVKPQGATVPRNLSGTWQGVLYQPEGPWQRYAFTLVLQVQGQTVAGYSRIEVPGSPYFGVMALGGKTTAKGLAFNETRFIDGQTKHKIADGTVWETSFCLKYARDLGYDAREETLSGTWDGCFPPGTMLLHRTTVTTGLAALPAAGGASLQAILFDPDQAVLKPGAEVVIREAKARFGADPSLRIRILGHADANESSGQRGLSLKRAQVVARALERKGIPKGNLSLQGCGTAHPVADSSLIVGREANRRVELLLEGPPAAEPFPKVAPGQESASAPAP